MPYSTTLSEETVGNSAAWLLPFLRLLRQHRPLAVALYLAALVVAAVQLQVESWAGGAIAFLLMLLTAHLAVRFLAIAPSSRTLAIAGRLTGALFFAAYFVLTLHLCWVALRSIAGWSEELYASPDYLLLVACLFAFVGIRRTFAPPLTTLVRNAAVAGVLGILALALGLAANHFVPPGSILSVSTRVVTFFVLPVVLAVWSLSVLLLLSGAAPARCGSLGDPKADVNAIEYVTSLRRLGLALLVVTTLAVQLGVGFVTLTEPLLSARRSYVLARVGIVADEAPARFRELIEAAVVEFEGGTEGARTWIEVDEREIPGVGRTDVSVRGADTGFSGGTTMEFRLSVETISGVHWTASARRYITVSGFVQEDELGAYLESIRVDREANLRELETIAKSLQVSADTGKTQISHADELLYRVENAFSRKTIKVPVVGLDLQPKRASPALVALALATLVLIRDRLRVLLRARSFEAVSPWIVLDGRTLAGRCLAAGWLVGLVVSPVVVCLSAFVVLGASRTLSGADGLDTTTTTGWFFLTIAIGIWMGLRTCADALLLRASGSSMPD